MPEVFRLLCGCGFRVGEVLNLRVGTRLDQGVIAVRQGKFRKDCLVPPALPLVDRLRTYAAGFGSAPRSQSFPGAEGKALSPAQRLRLVSSTPPRLRD
jgi:integrase